MKQWAATHFAPGWDYYVAIGKPPLDIRRGHDDGTEYLPVEITLEGKVMPLDGAYDLIEDIIEYMRVALDAKGYADMTPELEDRLGSITDHYLGSILRAISDGRGDGTVTGEIGDRQWRLVKWLDKDHKKSPVPAKLSADAWAQDRRGRVVP